MELSHLRILAWLAFAAIAFASIVPIGLRPHLPIGQFAEHVLAFSVLGALFGLAYPRHLFLVILLLASTALVLEGLQLLNSTRHATNRDLVIKLGAGIAGAALSQLPRLISRRFRRPGR
jgi:hypothetical protein